MSSLCPLRVSSSLPLAASQTLAVPSTGGDDPLAVRREGHRQNRTDVPLEGDQFLATGRVPHLGSTIPTACDNPLTVWRKRHGRNRIGVPSESLDFQVGLPLPVIPLESALRLCLRFVQ